MKITLINGFHLPVPPVVGGSTEKTWFRLGQEFAARGCTVTSLSREWPGFPPRETISGVHHRRLKGYAHGSSLKRNLYLDLLWSWRCFHALPPADIVLSNAVALPVWLGSWRPSAGKVVVMSGRMPKGQYRWYRKLARVLAPSRVVQERLIAEKAGLAPIIRVTGYPIDWTLHATREELQPRAKGEITLGYIGRIHEEKGLRLLAEAVRLLAMDTRTPSIRLLLCGPVEIAQGGSGPSLRAALAHTLSHCPGVISEWLPPEFDEARLARIYRRCDVFCYPSLAKEGETFGVAIAEAMAAGAVPVVSSLPCFRDLVVTEHNGLVFDHEAPDAASRLSGCLARLINDKALRQRLAGQARADTRRYDFPEFAAALLKDFQSLLTP